MIILVSFEGLFYIDEIRSLCKCWCLFTHNWVTRWTRAAPLHVKLLSALPQFYSCINHSELCWSLLIIKGDAGFDKIKDFHDCHLQQNLIWSDFMISFTHYKTCCCFNTNLLQSLSFKTKYGSNPGVGLMFWNLTQPLSLSINY